MFVLRKHLLFDYRKEDYYMALGLPLFLFMVFIIVTIIIILIVCFLIGLGTLGTGITLSIVGKNTKTKVVKPLGIMILKLQIYIMD